ncbi:MAG: DNA methylase, partial [Chloroflexota bacterium]|nr:DNA methylase [Chloroflexota bacterium]
MAKVASPGHKLGQMIGNFFEEFFSEDLQNLSNRLGVYCDKRGPRPKVRGNARRVAWKDSGGNSHDLDFVVEKGGSENQRGLPIAFIEIAWRRYTKHSRNKTGELEGALLPLRESYPSCRFVGVVLAGEYTEGGKTQLTSHGITVLHIPFETLADAFQKKGVDLNYPERAPTSVKQSVIERWESLSGKALKEIKQSFYRAIADDYKVFKMSLESALSSKIEAVRILPLYGSPLVFSTLSEARIALG